MDNDFPYNYTDRDPTLKAALYFLCNQSSPKTVKR